MIKKNQSFDLVVKGQGYSELIFIQKCTPHSVMPCYDILYIHTKYELHNKNKKSIKHDLPVKCQNS